MTKRETPVQDPDVFAAQAGDERAFARLVQRYECLLTQHLLQYTTNGTVLEDLLQDVYIEIYRSLPSYRHEGHFPGWIRTIASRVGYRYWSGRAREAEGKAAFLEMFRADELGSSSQGKKDKRRLAEVLLTGLGSCDRMLMEMRYLEGRNSAEIARIMGWKPGRVRVRLHRAIAKLQRSCERNLRAE